MLNSFSCEEFTIYTWENPSKGKDVLAKYLLQVISEISPEYYPDFVLEQDSHFIYLVDFLSFHEVCCILVEHKYFSQSYIEDYHQRFFLGLTDYNRYSKRIHFFQKPPHSKYISNEAAAKSIFLDFGKEGADKELVDFWDDKNYIGNIFLRPLPTGLIGVTILKPYGVANGDHAAQERFYPAIHDYKINLFGVERNFKSLVYTSQDSISGACATAALFSAFYKYSELFQTPILSPGNITSHGKLFQENSRLFPNRGLTSLQMKSAIHAIGLECEILSDEKAINEHPYFINEAVMAYLRGGLPIIFSFKFPGTEDYHAVTICGYSIKQEGKDELVEFLFNKETPDLPQLQSQKYIKFYAHDDHIGPFSRLFIKGNDVTSGWWEDNHHPEVKTKVEFTDLMVAYPDVIKVGFSDIRIQISNFHKVLFSLQYLSQDEILNEVSWDVYLVRSNAYKKEMQHKVKDAATHVLFECLPKYIWLVKCFNKGELLFDLVVDSTSVDPGFSPLKIIIFKEEIATDLTDIFMTYYDQTLKEYKEELKRTGDDLLISAIQCLDFFYKELKPRDEEAVSD